MCALLGFSSYAGMLLFPTNILMVDTSIFGPSRWKWFLTHLFFLPVLEIEPRPLITLGKHSTTEYVSSHRILIRVSWELEAVSSQVSHGSGLGPWTVLQLFMCSLFYKVAHAVFCPMLKGSFCCFVFNLLCVPWCLCVELREKLWVVGLLLWPGFSGLISGIKLA